MSVEASKWAWDQQMPAHHKIVLLAIADWANKTGFCYPGQASIGKAACKKERAVRDSIKWLENEGFISRERRFREDGSRTSDSYQLSMPPPADVAGGENSPPAAERRHHRRQTAGKPLVEPPVLPSSKEEGSQATKFRKKSSSSSRASSSKNACSGQVTKGTNNYVATYVDNCPVAPLSRNKAILGREAKALAKEVPRDVVERAVIALAKKDEHPSKLSVFVHYERKKKKERPKVQPGADARERQLAESRYWVPEGWEHDAVRAAD